LFDAAGLAPILGAVSTRVVPVEGVVGTIQVKSNATKASIDSAISNIASAKRLQPATQRYGHPPGDVGRPGPWGTAATFFGGILCLSGPSDVNELFEHFGTSVSGMPARERPDALCIVDKATVLWGNPSRGPGVHLCFRAEDAEAPLLCLAKADSLLFFYLCLVEHINHWIPAPMSWLDYVVGRDRQSGLTFDYSYWIDEDRS
jgi:hypothetical protein